MTETTIDRLARAAYRAYRDGDHASYDAAWRYVVRAILQEMREPGEGALMAAIEYDHDGRLLPDITRDDAAGVWQAMIDHILAEKP